jgi:hypothetical protein
VNDTPLRSLQRSDAVAGAAAKRPLDRADLALLAAYLLAAAVGTWTRCLLINDGAVFLTAGWLGNTWDLYFSQDADRTVSLLLTYGPAVLAHGLFGLSAGTYIVVAHILYFAAPLLLWLALRAIEEHRVYSRLYLAIALSTIYFPTEVIVGYGLWLIWLAIVVERTRTAGQVVLATVLFGAALAFTHPSIALIGIVYVAVGTVLTFSGRPVPRRSLVAVAAMSALLLLAYAATSRFLPATNPTVIVTLAANRYDFIDPSWMMATIVLFPAFAALWLLLLAPGTQSAGLRWRVGWPAIVAIAALGVWFAAACTGPLAWVYARHTAGYVLALALALALVWPSRWVEQARRPLMAYAVVIAAAVISYNVDLFVFGRFVDAHAKPGAIDVDEDSSVGWPPRLTGVSAMRSYFKWGAGADYQRDVVVPLYDWYKLTLAFYSYFHSDRQSILFHEMRRHGDWIPYSCPAVARTLALPHDPQDRWFLSFLGSHYCVP